MGDYLETHTHRQHLAWLAWLEQDLDRPGKLECYLMQCAAEAFYAFRKRPEKVDLKPFRLQFGESASEEKKPPTPLTPEQIKALTRTAQAEWAARMGVPVRIVKG